MNGQKTRECYLRAIGLDRHNWGAYVNLAIADAWLEEEFDTSIEVLKVGLREMKQREKRKEKKRKRKGKRG